MKNIVNRSAYFAWRKRSQRHIICMDDVTIGRKEEYTNTNRFQPMETEQRCISLRGNTSENVQSVCTNGVKLTSASWYDTMPQLDFLS